MPRVITPDLKLEEVTEIVGGGFDESAERNRTLSRMGYVGEIDVVGCSVGIEPE